MTTNKTWIKLNVGGKIFLTTTETLQFEPSSELSKYASGTIGQKDENGAIMIDRDPDLFEIILTYLRTKHIMHDKYKNIQVLIDEALYYNLSSLALELEDIRKRRSFERVCRIYRLMTVSLNDLVATLSEVSDGWKFEQLIELTEKEGEYLCIISKKTYGDTIPVSIPSKLSGKKKKQ